MGMRAWVLAWFPLFLLFCWRQGPSLFIAVPRPALSFPTSPAAWPTSQPWTRERRLPLSTFLSLCLSLPISAQCRWLSASGASVVHVLSSGTSREIQMLLREAAGDYEDLLRWSWCDIPHTKGPLVCSIHTFTSSSLKVHSSRYGH